MLEFVAVISKVFLRFVVPLSMYGTVESLMNTRIKNSTAKLIYAAVALLSLAIAFWLKTV